MGNYIERPSVIRDTIERSSIIRDAIAQVSRVRDVIIATEAKIMIDDMVIAMDFWAWEDGEAVLWEDGTEILTENN